MRSPLLYWALTLLIGLTTCVFGHSELKVNEKTILFLKQFRQDYSKSLVNKNPETLQVYYADTIMLMPAFQKTIQGRSNVLRYHKAFSSRFTIQSHVRKEIEILDLGTQVMEIGTFSTKLTMNKTGNEQALIGKYMNLWKKLNNGELLLITEGWNYDQYYGGLHEQLKFEEVPSMHLAMRPNVPVTNNIRFELAALCRLLDATVTQHDARTWSLFFADDSMLMPGYHPVCNGKKEIDAYINAHVKGLPTFEELDIRNHRIDDLGVYVVEYASQVASWKIGDNSGVNMGKNIRIWRREPDHALKLFRAIAMYD